VGIPPIAHSAEPIMQVIWTMAPHDGTPPTMAISFLVFALRNNRAEVLVLQVAELAAAEQSRPTARVANPSKSVNILYICT
jgi:hypothetical protein